VHELVKLAVGGALDLVLTGTDLVTPLFRPLLSVTVSLTATCTPGRQLIE